MKIFLIIFMFHLPPDLSTRAAQSKSKSNYKSKTLSILPSLPLCLSVCGAPFICLQSGTFIHIDSLSIVSLVSCFLIKTSAVAQSERPRWLISFYNKRTSCVLSILFDMAGSYGGLVPRRERERVLVASLWAMIDSNDSRFC